MSKRRALISVSDKSQLDFLACELAKLNFEILSTGGTAHYLRDLDLEVVDVSDYTGFPELFSGRVKTLHPKIHGGLLYRREKKEDCEQAEKNGIGPIDLVVVNLYPFEETVAQKEVTVEKAIEQIDIGGPALLRSAAKNYKNVTVVTDPSDYASVLEELKKNKGATTFLTREKLAIKVFQKTSRYDHAISSFLKQSEESGDDTFSLDLPLDRKLRYGENPHQSAVLYGRFADYFTQLQGKELSYTNVLDIEVAGKLITEFKRPLVAILKHTNPCGVGVDDKDLRAAWQKAFETDTQAPFGGVIACNRPLDESLGRVVAEIKTDIIIAPDFEVEARALLQKKKNLRLIKMSTAFVDTVEEKRIRSVSGGLLVMDADPKARGLNKLEEKVVTKRPPTSEEIEAMRFAWRVVKHVKSNAIVLAKKERTLGVGAGQMSRVDASRIAVWKAKEAGLDIEGSVMASDALIPFPDGLIAAAEAGATAVIQPGGSIRDEEVIAAADEREVAMVFTGFRHFLH